MEEFSPRCTSKMEMAIPQSPDDGSSWGTVSMVVDRSQTILCRDRRALLLKLEGLESDRAGVLGGWLILLQSRELSMGVTLCTVLSVALCLHGELGLDIALGGVVGLSLLGLQAGTAVVLGCGLTAGMCPLALDAPGWHGPLCWLSAAGRWLLGTWLASCPLDGL